jgi:acylphosphatase
MKRVKISVTGDVQGVFYRHNTMKEAKSLDIKGWCRNEPDGSVFIVAEGEDAAVNKLIRWAKDGSPLASVENVEVVEEKPTGEEKDFEIR